MKSAPRAVRSTTVLTLFLNIVCHLDNGNFASRTPACRAGSSAAHRTRASAESRLRTAAAAQPVSRSSRSGRRGRGCPRPGTSRRCGGRPRRPGARSKPAERSSQTRRLLEVAGQLVVAPGPHDQQVPADLVAPQPRLGEVVDPVRPGGEQHDLQLGIEQRRAACCTSSMTGSSPHASKNDAPVLARRLDVVLAARRVGQHAVDVDDDRRAGHERLGAPGPVFGEVRARVRYSSAGCDARYAT